MKNIYLIYIKYLVFLVAFFLISYSLHAQTIATGYVYHDKNENGKKDRSEKGISGVSVSNGVQVVQTDGQGKYSVPVEEDNIIFVIKPENYRLPVNDKYLPQFYYIHKPQGSPSNLKYKGVAPTGPLPKSVDFALIPQRENDEFTHLVFGDPQPYNLREVDYFSKGIVAEITDTDNIAFGLSLGDLVGNNPDLFQPYAKAISQLRLPWFNVIGNHDINFDVEVDSLSDEAFEANFGPTNYAFNYGKVHFIILDNIIYPNPKTGKGYIGGFQDSQLEFIKNNLQYVSKDKLVVVAFHIPLRDRLGRPLYRVEDRERFFELLAPFPHTLSLSAHTHVQYQDFFDKEAGWQQDKPHHHYNVGTTSGDWYSGELDDQGIPISTMRDGTPKGYAYINYTGNQYTIDYKVAGKPADYQIKIHIPHVAQQKSNLYKIVANFFM
ncbi:MAG TPA: calcineurin-like phosphoesterase family protein, partial [Sphingobacterium sp.]|nr:calcineurin-like phosphoesterase family protein [Sphingobacterium sp.]